MIFNCLKVANYCFFPIFATINGRDENRSVLVSNHSIVGDTVQGHFWSLAQHPDQTHVDGEYRHGRTDRGLYVKGTQKVRQ